MNIQKKILGGNIQRIILTIDEALELSKKLKIAVEEANDHQMIQSAFLPMLGLSIQVDPDLKRFPDDE